MASTFVIHARHDWIFQLVLLGSRLQLEGWCDDECCHCSAWMEPTDAPHDVAEQLMRQPSCCL
jgi:hypothetical protein